MFSRTVGKQTANSLRIAFDTTKTGLDLRLKFDEKSRIQIERSIYKDRDGRLVELRPNLSQEEIYRLAPEWLREPRAQGDTAEVVRDRCFLTISYGGTVYPIRSLPDIGSSIENIIHLPGLRGNPERTYPTSAVAARFPGEFQKYIASIINHRQEEKDSEELRSLATH
jgi:hypothetical protein